MPTRAWCFGCALLVAAEILLLHRLPFPLLDPGQTVFDVLAFTSLSMMLWISLRPGKSGEKLKCVESSPRSPEGT